MLRKSVIPPHVGIKGRINHKFPDLNAMNIQIARGLVDFKAPQQGNRKKKILINNFGATVRLWKSSSEILANNAHYREEIQVF